jgi:ATP-dependent protease HslVU (ClpYQ) peptidase subunit
MTTIAYDHSKKQIAVDSRASGDNLIHSDKAKKWLYHKSEIWFFTGSLCDNEKLLGMEHDHNPEVKPDCTALMVKDSQVYLVTFNGDYCAHTKIDYDFTLGSGSDFALAALDFNKTAKEAVAYAKTRDTKTGGKVHVYDIASAKFL